MFRWKAVGPLALFAVVSIALWLLFADRIAKRAAESVGTALLGAKVEIAGLHLDPAHGRVAARGLTVASPFAALENVLEADQLVADLAPAPLLEKKLVIDRLAATGLRFGTPRATDGRTRGGSDGVIESVTRWGEQLHVPPLALATGRISVNRLDPAQLNTPRFAAALERSADSARQAWNEALRGLDVRAAVDSAKRMGDRVKGAKPTDLKLLGDARRTLAQVKATQERVAGLEQSVRAGIASLQAGATGLDAARERDYALARGLLKLPDFDAPDIGAALFGRAAIDRFQRALYWAELGRRYMPPGLLPRATPGPARARRAGTTVRFPRTRGYPGFLLKAADLSVQLGGGDGAPRTYAARLAGLTSDPALYGRPATVVATAPNLRVAALLDHVRASPRDTVTASLDAVALPSLPLGSLPMRLEPGRGAVTLSFALDGDEIRARWTVQAARVRWVRDSAGAGSQLGDLAWQVLSGIATLDVSASLTGSVAHPRLAVGSNLDRALAERLRALAGKEIVAAERRVRAQVDSVAGAPIAAARARVASLATDVLPTLGSERAQLDAARSALEQRLRELTRLPGVRLP